MRKYFTNLGLLQIFCALLLVICIMFLSNYYVYKNSISNIYEKVTENNDLAVKSTVQSFDNSFRAINNIIHSIHGLPYNNLQSEEPGEIDMEKVYLMQDSLTTLIASVDYVEEAVVFYDGIELAITSSGTSSVKQLFNNKYKHDLFTADYWRQYMRLKNSFKIFPGQYFKISTESTGQNRKKLMIAVAGNKVRMSNKNIILLIDEDKFLKHINQSFMVPGSSLVVLDNDRQVLFSAGAPINVSNLLNEVYFSSSLEATMTREDYEYHFYKSDFNGYIYIDRIPYQFKNIDSVTQANKQIMISAIICAVILSLFLSIYLNRPVKKILRQLGGGSSRGNDFRKILSGIVKMQSELKEYKNELKYIDIEARRGVFLQSLDEYSHSAEHEEQMNKYYSGFFLGKKFVLVMLQLNANKGVEQGELSIEGIADIVQESLRGERVGSNVFYERQMKFLAIVSLDQGSEREALIKRLRLMLARLEKEELSGYSIWASVSKVYDAEAKYCRTAYQEVVTGMMYRDVTESCFVMDIEKIQYEWGIYFPFEKIEKLSNCVLNGKLNEGKGIIQEIISDNAQRKIHHHQLAHIARTMFFYMARHANSSVNANNELYMLERRFMAALDNAHDYRLIEQELIEAAGLIAKHSQVEAMNKLNPTFISQYIELHYMENLYLDHIAEVVETSPKYFSSYFKKTFGVNYVEYLNKVRLSHARELLKDTVYTVGEIGEKTGYLNSSTFTTTFKKYYGISPSEYRKQHAS